MMWVTISSFVLGFIVVAARQQIFAANKFSSSLDGLHLNNAFQAYGSLNVLSDGAFTILEHPAFPHYGVRIKKSKFCDETVDAYTGYIDIEARHLFFFFFESRSDPDEDDVVFWTNGGPGGSSTMGMLMELGPCRVVNSTHTKPFHEGSWNDKANVFFIDQPVNVGFSYADYGEMITTTEDAAQDIAAFVQIFFEQFSKFKGRRFHMAGESYGGRYLPLFASAIYDQNQWISKLGMTPINLNSVMIGNGMIDPHTQLLAGYDMLCTGASLPPIFPISSCVQMLAVLPRCKKWVKEACVDQLDYINCGAAIEFCDKALGLSQEPDGELMVMGKNPFDISKDCEGPFLETACYPIVADIASYLSQPTVRSTLGVSEKVPQNFSFASWAVNRAFEDSGDELRASRPFVSALLERGVRVLVYNGAFDAMCSWVGSERLTRELDWSGRDGFGTAEMREWVVDGERAGVTRSWGPLTFVVIEGAGHMAPYDKPKETLEMVNRWLIDAEI